MKFLREKIRKKKIYKEKTILKLNKGQIRSKNDIVKIKKGSSIGKTFNAQTEIAFKQEFE